VFCGKGTCVHVYMCIYILESDWGIFTQYIYTYWSCFVHSIYILRNFCTVYTYWILLGWFFHSIYIMEFSLGYLSTVHTYWILLGRFFHHIYILESAWGIFCTTPFTHQPDCQLECGSLGIYHAQSETLISCLKKCCEIYQNMWKGKKLYSYLGNFFHIGLHQ
jgi:hypothetical protein